jgi:fluoride ion exporter CrcB/FEX
MNKNKFKFIVGIIMIIIAFILPAEPFYSFAIAMILSFTGGWTTMSSFFDE